MPMQAPALPATIDALWRLLWLLAIVAVFPWLIGQWVLMHSIAARGALHRVHWRNQARRAITAKAGVRQCQPVLSVPSPERTTKENPATKRPPQPGQVAG